MGPLIEVPSATSLQEEAPRDPEKGCSEFKCWNRCCPARVLAAASLLARGSAGTSKLPEEPLTGEGTGCPGVQARSPCGQGASARVDQETRMIQERRGPVSPTMQAKEEQSQIGASWLLKTITQEQPGLVSHIRPDGRKQPQVEVPCWPRSVKQEEGRIGWAEYQES